MRCQVLVAITLILLTVCQGGCLGNGPNPMKTCGDHVAAAIDGVTTAVLSVPGVILLGLWLMEQSLTALIRSDGGSGYEEPTEEPACPDEEPVEFPPPAGDEPTLFAPGSACG